MVTHFAANDGMSEMNEFRSFLRRRGIFPIFFLGSRKQDHSFGQGRLRGGGDRREEEGSLSAVDHLYRIELGKSPCKERRSSCAL